MPKNYNINAVEYAVIVDGKILFKSPNAIIAENYKFNLEKNLQEKASIKAVDTNGKELLLG